MKAHELVGTFFIATSWIDTASYLTQENLQGDTGRPADPARPLHAEGFWPEMRWMRRHDSCSTR
jgi:hypothetical protein